MKERSNVPTLKRSNFMMYTYLFMLFAFLIAPFSFLDLVGQESSDDSWDVPVEEPPTTIKEKGGGEVFMVVKKMPEFPGGKEKMERFILNNLKYPELAKEKGVKGLVVVSFIVRKTGKLDEVKVRRGLGAGCDQEAIRLIESMPNWTPGEQRGRKVDVQYNLPLRFKLPSESSNPDKQTDKGVRAAEKENSSSGMEKLNLPKQDGYLTQIATPLLIENTAKYEKIFKKLEKKTGVKATLLVVDDIHPIGNMMTYATGVLKNWKTVDPANELLIVLNRQQKKSVVMLDENSKKVDLLGQLANFSYNELDPLLKNNDQTNDLRGLKKSIKKLIKLLNKE